MSTSIPKPFMSTQEQLASLEARRASTQGLSLEERMDLEDQIFELRKQIGLVKIDRESSMFECVGCGS